MFIVDVSCRDLLLRRDTNSDGDTVWQRQPLVQAVLNGQHCELHVFTIIFSIHFQI
jgi:hypothetical protein